MANSIDRFGGSASVNTKELRQERAVRTRERILLAAAEAFAAKGYPGVTILDIAQGAGMTKGAVYFHYVNKEALAVAVTDLFYRRIAEVADGVAESGLPPVSAVAELLIRTALAFQQEATIQAGARLQLERIFIDAQLTAPFRGYTDLVAGWLADGARELGAEWTCGDPATLATVLVSAFFGAQHMSWVLCDRADLLERTVAIVRTILPCVQGDIDRCPSAPYSRYGAPGGG